MKARILLVDDNKPTRDVLTMALEFLGYEVTVAINGADAVAHVESYAPDLIVMDILMPEMDGFEAASWIRKNPKTRSIPILAATAKGDPGDREKCLASGCDDFIAKPFPFHRLDETIKKLLKKRAQ